MKNVKFFLVVILIFALFSCRKWKKFEKNRSDNAQILAIDLRGSLQNPAFSPDGSTLVFTCFSRRYNKGKASLYQYNLETKELSLLVEGGVNVNLPGSSWNPMTNKIVFSSERNDNHDEIYMIDANGKPGDEVQITQRNDRQSFEPSFSPNGERVVFESHPVDVEDQGVITVYEINGSGDYIELSTSSENLKQPNWSPAGDKILYQKQEGDSWNIWTMNTDGSEKTQLTFNGESTDAAFSSDGEWVYYSSGGEGIKHANIFRIPSSGGQREQITYSSDYDGAPSISPQGDQLAFEGFYKDPDRSKGTKLCLVAVLP